MSLTFRCGSAQLADQRDEVEKLGSWTCEPTVLTKTLSVIEQVMGSDAVIDLLLLVHLQPGNLHGYRDLQGPRQRLVLEYNFCSVRWTFWYIHTGGGI